VCPSLNIFGIYDAGKVFHPEFGAGRGRELVDASAVSF